jgi:starch-binding outer membrane protein, SusD/RagB family
MFIKIKINMKKIFGIIIIISIMLSSCSDDFIDLVPISDVTVDYMYKTDKDFEDAVNAFYTTLQSLYNQWWQFGDIPGEDNTIQVIKDTSWDAIDGFYINSSYGLLNTAWGNRYQVIHRINTMLQMIETKSLVEVPNKERYIAEAKFHRAFNYFDLVRIFGDVPKVTKTLSIEEAYNTPRAPVKEIYEEIIIPDLIAAANGLPPTWSGKDIGRVTRGAAKSILGRVYLTRNDFINAEATLQEVTTMGYALLPDYNDLWNYSIEHHSEYIFDAEYETGLGGRGSVFTHYFMPNSHPMFVHYGVVPGGTNELNSPTPELIGLFEPQDSRLRFTWGPRGGFWNHDSVFIAVPPATQQDYTLKYMTSVADVHDSRANWKIIRYADVLLMYAEALNENNKTELALNYLNQIRSRAGVDSYAGLTKDQTRERIWIERRMELAFEGHRWFDLVRTGQAYQVLQHRGMQPHQTVFPIPRNQLDLINDPNVLWQNPGYVD